MKNSHLLYGLCCKVGFLFFVLLAGLSPTWAAPLEPESMDSFNVESLLDDDGVVTISLKDVVLQALEHNLDITVSRQSRDVRVTDILFEQAKFDPTVEMSARYDRSIVPLNRPVFGFGGVTQGAEPDNFDQNDTQASLGLTQKLYSGGTYDMALDTNRNSVAGSSSFLFNPGYTANFLVNFTQPLLRDFGAKVNQTAIHIAQNSVQVEHYTFVREVLEVIAEVEQAYWELVFARENESVFREALTAAKELLASNRAKVKAGVMADVEVLQAKTGVANRVEQILVAQKAVRDQEDQLRQLISPTEEELRQTLVLVPLDRPAQDRDASLWGHAVDAALQHRPEILQAKTNIESSTLNTSLAKNKLLPRLEFQGSVGLSGLGKEVGDTLDRTRSTDFYNLGAGMVLSYPLGNRSAQSQYRRRQLEADQAKSTLQNVRRQVIVDSKEAVRRVKTDLKRMATTRIARKLAERQRAAEQERLNLGLSTTRQVLEFQRDEAIARVNALRAIVDYNQSLANLNRMTVATLDKYAISLR
ncbi:TolC family protein [Candidatus Nitronereus thalassa]|uniref:TolC family protein n=1 Tax=Candidatus Nitronereus thalassa TaxID=3020898 RepID=A0ABU3K3F1_9BACT|nr:TolC family protein [Candidatus Nitronereus thalassa]MDT7040922.1 TolC family protein [Candidatus Nitronereus thalassa]